MKDKMIQTFDIASYDIELDFNNKIAPIEKAIQSLNSKHETKSLRSHKDFLKKEQKSTDTITQLQEKAVLKQQRIERAVENKLKKLEPKKSRYDDALTAFIEEKTTAADEEIAVIKETITELEQEELARIDEIKTKYKESIESYVEKLSIYNNNFERNKQEHNDQINNYQEQINLHIDEMKTFYQDMIETLETNLARFLVEKESSDQSIKQSYELVSRQLGTVTNNIRKGANVTITEANAYVDALQKEFDNHYQQHIESIEAQIDAIQSRFNERVSLIEKDLEINVDKLEQEQQELSESSNKKALKNVSKKLDLFQLRAKTTMRYEERLLDEQLLLLKQEQKLVRNEHQFEQDNLDKLRVFLISDQNSLKETGDYFKNLNLVLKEQLNNFEFANNEYIYKHEQLKADFIKHYTVIFRDLKQATIDMAQTHLEKIADNNHEIDDINKFLDTAEPLKEIEVNRLRENIEINEQQERYKIKYAKQQYEINLITNRLAFDIRQEEINTKEQLSDHQRDIVNIRNKEVYDKALEKAKLKHKKAEQVYKLRTNNTSLERRLLESKYQTETSILEEQKKLAKIEVQKDNALQVKEIEYAIKNLELEANYQIEVIQKGLEEELLKLDEEVAKHKYEKDSYKANLDADIEAKTASINKQKRDIEETYQAKLDLIDTALERELREPQKNKVKTETIINERLAKLDMNNGIFGEYVATTIDSFTDDTLSLEQTRDIILSNNSLTDKASKYLDRAYTVFTDALTFMNDIEQRNYSNKIAASSDQGKIKKWKKQIQKTKQELVKALNTIHQAKNDHVATVSNLITSEMETISRSNPNSVGVLLEQTDVVYQKVYNKLSTIQNDIRDNTKQLYQPLMQHDQELIDYANENATTAKGKVEAELIEKLAPLDQELQEYTKQQYQDRDAFYEGLDQTINELKAQINHKKNNALDQVKSINATKDELVNEKVLQKQQYEEQEQQQIIVELEKVDKKRSDLEENYTSALEQLDTKDAEAKNIFEYEDRIYNIAVESATSRYNDALVKADNVHLNNVNTYKVMLEQAKKDADTQEQVYNQELLDMTKAFERNIYTVRPRLEESIGDAQKEIDQQIGEKTAHLEDLQANNERIVTSAQTALYAAFQDSYDKLSDNLQNYIEKYRVIEEEYHRDNNQANDIIHKNNIAFKNAIYQLQQTKHQTTLEQLEQINAQVFGKGE